MSNIPISNPPADLTMGDMLATSSAFGGLAKSCRYYVRIIPQGTKLVGLKYNTFVSQLSYLVEAAEMPGRGFTNVDAKYYGPSFKMPVLSMYEDTSMTFLCRTQSFERQFFDDWMEIINPSNTWDFSYKDDYRAEIQVYQLADYAVDQDTRDRGRAPAAMYQWTLHEVWPMLINPQPITWADDNFQRLTVSFTYSHWSRRGRDVTAGNFRDNFISGKNVEGLPQRNL